MKHLLIKYPIIIFCLTNILLEIVVGFIFSFDYVPIQIAPGLLAILIISILKGRMGIYTLLQKTLFKKVYLKWYIFALVIPIVSVSVGLSYIIISIIEQQELTFPRLNYSSIEYSFILFTIILGSYGEEIGWRGFLFPKLQKKHSLFISSFIIGLFWGIWHLRFEWGILIFVIYLLLTTEFSFILSWLCIKEGGNIMSAIIFHSAINLCSFIFFESIMNTPNSQTLTILYAVYCFVFMVPCLFAIKSLLTIKKIDM